MSSPRVTRVLLFVGIPAPLLPIPVDRLLLEQLDLFGVAPQLIPVKGVDVGVDPLALEKRLSLLRLFCVGGGGAGRQAGRHPRRL